MDFATLWLPIVGTGVFGCIAITAWYSSKQIEAIWFGFVGIVCLLILAALQWQAKVLTKAESQPAIETLKASSIDERPLLKFEKIDVSDITYSEGKAGVRNGQLTANVHVRVRNVGKIIANGVFLDSVFIANRENAQSEWHDSARAVLKEHLLKSDLKGRYNRVVFPMDVFDYDFIADSDNPKLVGNIDFTDASNHLVSMQIIVGVGYRFGANIGYTVCPVIIIDARVLPNGLMQFQTSVMKTGVYRSGKDFSVMQHWQGVEAE